MARLKEAGHHVERAEKGTLDAAVWRHAQEAALAVMTGNADDFIALADQTPGHHGLLLVYGEHDPLKQMRAADIAAALEFLREFHGDALRGQRVALNLWRR